MPRRTMRHLCQEVRIMNHIKNGGYRQNHSQKAEAIRSLRFCGNITGAGSAPMRK
jgi:hypothetical protein